MTSSGAEAEMEALYRTYIDIFNRQDSAALSRLLSFPAAGTGSEPLQVYESPRDFQRMIEATWEHFKKQGWARSQVDTTRGALMAGDTGIVYITYSRFRGDGSLYERGSGYYVMRRIDGAWKIVGMFVPNSGSQGSGITGAAHPRPSSPGGSA